PGFTTGDGSGGLGGSGFGEGLGDGVGLTTIDSGSPRPIQSAAPIASAKSAAAAAAIHGKGSLRRGPTCARATITSSRLDAQRAGSDPFPHFHAWARGESGAARRTRLCCQSLPFPKTGRSDMAIGSDSHAFFFSSQAKTVTCSSRSAHAGGVLAILTQCSLPD